jgi:hypothetical protein
MKIPFDTSQLCCGVVHLLSERIKKLIEFLTVAAKHCRKAEHSLQLVEAKTLHQEGLQGV